MALTVFGFFFNLNLRVEPDGSGRMFIEFPPNPLTSWGTEAQRFGSPVSSVTGFRINKGRAQIRVRFRDLNGLKDAPGLSNSVVHLEDGPGGTGRFSAILRTIAPGDKPVLDNVEKARIQIRFPGPVLSANAERIDGRTAVWREPVMNFLSHDGIALDAAFQLPPSGVAEASEGGGRSG